MSTAVPGTRPLGRRPRPSGPRGGAAAILLGAACCLTTFLVVQLLDYGYSRDQGIYAVVAQEILQGGAPYKDAWDFKPPGIYFIYALAQLLFGPGPLSIRLLGAASLASLVFAFVVLSRRHLGRTGPGVVGGLLAAFAHVQLGPWHSAQPETFAAPLIAWALVCTTYEPVDGPRARVRTLDARFVAGALFMSAALLKPTLGGGLPAGLVYLVLRTRDAGAREGVAPRLGLPLIAYGMGAVAPLTLTMVYFSLHGAIGDLNAALFEFAPRYTALDFSWRLLPRHLAVALWGWLAGVTPYHALGVLALLVLRRPLGDRILAVSRERDLMALMLSIILLSLLGVALQGKFFRYHFATALVLAGLPAAWGYWKLWDRAGPGMLRWAVAVVLVVAVHARWIPGLADPMPFWRTSLARVQLMRHPERRDALRDRLQSTADSNSRANRLAAAWLAEHTAVGEPVFVWGFEPAIYQLSGRRPASRYIYNVPQRAEWTREAAREELLADLDANPPAAVVVESGDRFPWVTGNDRDSSAELERWPELAGWLRSRYRPATEIENLTIWTPSAKDGQD